MTVEWSQQARADLIEIFQYIAVDNPDAARTLLNKIRMSAGSITEQPLSGRVVPEFEVANIRERFVLPYRIIYRVLKDQVLVLTVIHARRNLGRFAAAHTTGTTTKE